MNHALKTLWVNPESYRRSLTNLQLPIPYFVFATKKWNLPDYVTPIKGGTREMKDSVFVDEGDISREFQIAQFARCLQTLDQKEGAPNWTMSISGYCDAGYCESLAALLAYRANKAGQWVVWVDVARAFRENASDIWGLKEMRGNAPSPRLVVITGLTEGSNTYRYERAMDLLRSAPYEAKRVVVSYGQDPRATMRRLYAPFQSAVFLTPSTQHVRNM